MDINLGTLKKKVLLVLADEQGTTNPAPIGGNSYPADLLRDGIHAALNAICSRIWKLSVITTSLGVDEVELPDDHIMVDSVYDNSIGVFIPRVQMQIGMSLVSSQGNAWHLFPSGKLKMVNTLTKGATVYYEARWALPDVDADVIEPPASTLTCLVLYAASYCLLQDASSSANIRQFNTKVDSGVPSDLPAKVISDFLLGRFERELQRLPQGERARNQ